MQRKIEIIYKSRHYIVKVSDEMKFEEVLAVLGIEPIESNYKLLLPIKNRYVQPFNKLKDVGVVNNDIIKVLLESYEKTV